MAAQYILEHNSHKTPDQDGFKCSMKNIVESHLCNPFNVSNRYSLRILRDHRSDVLFSRSPRFTTRVVARSKLYWGLLLIF